MKKLYAIVAVLTAVAVLGASATTLQQQVFAPRTCAGCAETAMGHGEDVSRVAIGDPGIVPETAMGHGEEVSDVATAPR